MKRVLVTGITGKSGLFFLKELVAHADELKDYHFKFFIRSTTDTTEIDEAQKVISMEKFVGDKMNSKDVNLFAKGGYDTLLHISQIRDSERVVSAAVNEGVKRIICVHTSGVFSKYKSAHELYDMVEANVRKMTSDAGTMLTILRPTMIYGTLNDGNMSFFIKMVDRFRLFPIVNGAKYDLQPVWCGDLGKAYYQVLMASNEVTADKEYVLSGGTVIQLIDILKEIKALLGTKNRFISVPFGLAFFGARCLNVLSRGKKDYRERVQRLIEPRAYSYEAAAKDFGYSPIDFHAGISAEVEMYKRAGCKIITPERRKD